MSLLCKGMALPSKSIPTKKKEQPMGGTCEYAGVCSYRNEDKTVCLNIFVKTNQRGARSIKLLKNVKLLKKYCCISTDFGEVK